MTDITTGLKFMRSDGTPTSAAARATGFVYPGPGVWVPPIPDPVPCQRGYHYFADGDILSWIESDPDAELWRIEARGAIVGHDLDGRAPKYVSAEMRLVERIEAWNDVALRLFAADCAEHVLHLFERERPGDDRPRRTIEVVRRFARGEATEVELAAARSAADAARDAAWDAARAAARAAAKAAETAARAAETAAWDAARAAARAARDAAAETAAWDAAWDAARAARDAETAAWDAARAAAAAEAAEAAARAAERRWQNDHLLTLLGLAEAPA